MKGNERGQKKKRAKSRKKQLVSSISLLVRQGSFIKRTCTALMRLETFILINESFVEEKREREEQNHRHGKYAYIPLCVQRGGEFDQVASPWQKRSREPDIKKESSQEYTTRAPK